MRRFKRLHDLPLTFASQFAGVKETARLPMKMHFVSKKKQKFFDVSRFFKIGALRIKIFYHNFNVLPFAPENLLVHRGQ